MNFRLPIFSPFGTYFWLGVGLLRLIGRYLYAHEGRPLLNTEKTTDHLHIRMIKGILYPCSISTYFENSQERINNPTKPKKVYLQVLFWVGMFFFFYGMNGSNRVSSPSVSLTKNESLFSIPRLIFIFTIILGCS